MRTAFVLLLFAALTALAQTSRVEGHVVTVDGKPISKATVRLTSRGSAAPNSNSTPSTYVEVTSSDGRFTVENIANGTYTINAQCAGYTVPTSVALRPALVIVASGETRGGIEVKLVPFAVVSGIVTDADGDPVLGSAVRLLRRTYNQGRMTFQPVSIATTDDRGQFRLSNVAEGRYYLVANGNPTPVGAVNEIRGRSALESNQTTYYPNSPTLEGAARLDVKPGALESLQVRLRRGVNSSIKGTVEMPGGTTGNSVQIQVLLNGLDATAQNVGVMMRPTGQFETPALSPGQYTVFARYNMPTTHGPPGTPLIPAKLFAGRTDVTVGGGNVENVAIRLTEAGEVSGRITMEGGGSLATNLPTTASRAAAPIPANTPQGSRMPLIILQAAESLATTTQTQAATDGTFSIPNVIPMKYQLNLNFLPPGTYIKSIRLAGQDVTTSLLNLNSGSGPLEILLSTKAAILTVTTPSAAAQGLQASIWPASGRTDNMPSLTLNAQGSIRLPALAPGDYYAVAWEESPPPDFARIPDFLTRFKDSAARVTLKEGETGNIEPKVISRDAMQKVLDDF